MNAITVLTHAIPRVFLRDQASHIAALFLLTTIALVCAPARAVDGCQVLLCFAAPSWRAVPQCVPPITQVLRDLARGKAFPTCAMSGPGSAADHAWSEAPNFCPPQYTRSYSSGSGPTYTCDYMGVVSVMVDGSLFTRTWWTIDGDTSTEFTPAAKAQLGTWDTRFDDDYAAWLNTRRPHTPVDFNN